VKSIDNTVWYISFKTASEYTAISLFLPSDLQILSGVQHTVQLPVTCHYTMNQLL